MRLHSFDGASRPGNVTRKVERDVSPETAANESRRKRLVGGYFYPLEVARALDGTRGEAYIAEAVARAKREPQSARRLSAKRARVASTPTVAY